MLKNVTITINQRANISEEIVNTVVFIDEDNNEITKDFIVVELDEDNNTAILEILSSMVY